MIVSSKFNHCRNNSIYSSTKIIPIIYPRRATKGHPRSAEMAVAKIANSYFLPYQAAIAAVLKYLEFTRIYFQVEKPKVNAILKK